MFFLSEGGTYKLVSFEDTSCGEEEAKDSGFRYLGDNFFYCRYWVVFVFHNLVLVSRV